MITLVFNCTILAFVMLCFFGVRETDSSLRIIGGGDARRGQFPYVARLEVMVTSRTPKFRSRYYLHVCTGAYLTATWMLIAAHCVSGCREIIDDSNTRLFKSKAVIRYEAPTGRRLYVNILSSHCHHAFKVISNDDINAVYNDICLLKSLPVNLTQYAKLSALDYSSLAGQSATAVGFGDTYVDGKVDIPALLGKTLQLLPVVIKTCDRQDLMSGELFPSLCISSRCGQAASICDGDSGGPLIHISGIVGINSMGIDFDCDLDAIKDGLSSWTVGLITPISPYIEWISDKINNDGYEKNV